MGNLELMLLVLSEAFMAEPSMLQQFYNSAL